MKKIYQIIRPFLLIIFGALILLCFLNLLQAEGETLAIGIIAIVMAAYYITVGILGVVIGDKINGQVRKLLDLISLVLFPLFTFINTLLAVIQAADFLGPNGWVISIITMGGSIGMVVTYLMASFSVNSLLRRLAQLFGLIFVLVLLLDILFTFNGTPVNLGDINVPTFAIYFIFANMIIVNLPNIGSEPSDNSEEEKID